MDAKSIDNLFDGKEDKKRAKIGLGVGLAGSVIGLKLAVIGGLGYAAFKTLKKPARELYEEVMRDGKGALQDIEGSSKEIFEQVKAETKGLFNDLKARLNGEDASVSAGEKKAYSVPSIYSRSVE